MMKSLIQFRLSKLTETTTSTGLTCQFFDTTPIATWNLHDVDLGSLKGAVTELTRQYLLWVIGGLPKWREPGERALPYMVIVAFIREDGSEEFLDVQTSKLTRRGLRLLECSFDRLLHRYQTTRLEKAYDMGPVVAEMLYEIN